MTKKSSKAIEFSAEKLAELNTFEAAKKQDYIERTSALCKSSCFARDLKQKDIAKMLGLSESCISAMLKKNRVLSPHKAQRLLKALELDQDLFICGKKEFLRKIDDKKPPKIETFTPEKLAELDAFEETQKKEYLCRLQMIFMTFKYTEDMQQQDIAKMLGISISFISLVIKDIKSMRVYKYARLLKALELDRDLFICDKKEFLRKIDDKKSPKIEEFTA